MGEGERLVTRAFLMKEIEDLKEEAMERGR